jgi:hypothetical protein
MTMFCDMKAVQCFVVEGIVREGSLWVEVRSRTADVYHDRANNMLERPGRAESSSS